MGLLHGPFGIGACILCCFGFSVSLVPFWNCTLSLILHLFWPLVSTIFERPAKYLNWLQSRPGNHFRDRKEARITARQLLFLVHDFCFDPHFLGNPPPKIYTNITTTSVYRGEFYLTIFLLKLLFFTMLDPTMAQEDFVFKHFPPSGSIIWFF